MNFRSSNANGYVHFEGEVNAYTGSSHGVQLTGGSTGGTIQPIGDDTDISLNVSAKGAGGIVIGANSSQSVTFSGSTRTFKGFYSQATTYSHAAIAVDRFVELTFASTTMDVDPADMFVIQSFEPAAESSVVSIHGTRLSAEDSSRVTVILGAQQSTDTSTGSGTIRVSWADLS